MDERQLAVGLNREPTIRSRHEPTTSDANELADEPLLLGPWPNVLDYCVRVYDVELVVVERQLPSICLDYLNTGKRRADLVRSGEGHRRDLI
jgi:hypothetical protein